jgi:hypothetical protein
VDRALESSSQGIRAVKISLIALGITGYSQLKVVPCCVNGFTPRVGRRW